MKVDKWDSERGAGGGSLGWVLVLPVILLLIFGGIQFSIVSYAKNLAAAAAQAGVRAATAAPASPDRGVQAAQAFLAQQAAGSIEGGQVAVSVDGNTVTFTITGTSTTIVPGMQVALLQSASGPMERLP